MANLFSFAPPINLITEFVRLCPATTMKMIDRPWSGAAGPCSGEGGAMILGERERRSAGCWPMRDWRFCVRECEWREGGTDVWCRGEGRGISSIANLANSIGTIT